MDQSKPKLSSLVTDDVQTDWTVDAIADQVFRSLNGSVTRETILQIIKQVAPRYENARIQTFVPILVQRDVMNKVFAMQKPLASEGAGVRETHQSE